MTCVCCVDDQIVRGLQVDDVNFLPERIHQIGAPSNDARSAKVIKNFIDRVIGNHIQKVLAIDKVTQCPSNHMEVGAAAS